MSRRFERARRDPEFVKRELLSERERRNIAYVQRNQAIVAFARLALRAGWPAGRHWDDDSDLHDTFRNVVIVDLPDGGQVSWHIALRDAHLIEDLPVHPTGFDPARVALGPAWHERVPMHQEEEA